MPYLLTVSRMDLSSRRQRWSDSSYRPTVRTIGSPELPKGYPGLLALVDDDGTVCRTLPLASPKGMLATPAGLLVACFAEIRLVTDDLLHSTTLASEPWFNDLHSLRPTPNGFAVAAAGVDAAFELSPAGETVWSWWAVEHGLSTDPSGQPRSVRKDGDHRGVSYPVEMQTTHLNALAALDDSTFLATVFQTGSLAAIDRSSGAVTPLLTALRRPHAVRVPGDGTVTLADTGAGHAVRTRVRGGRAKATERIDAGTSWLHDAHLVEDGWIFVDGAHSRVVHADAAGNARRVDTFDPDWCLYEVLPWEPRRSPATAERTSPQ